MTNNRKILEIKKRAEQIMKDWNYPNEHYIEANGALMVCNELLASLKDEGEKVMSADEIINKWELILSKDENMDITYSRQVLKEMLSDFKEYSHPSPAIEKCYPEGFVEWWFYNGCMNFAIEAFSKPVLFIKFDEGSAKKYTLQDLLTHWKEKVNN